MKIITRFYKTFIITLLSLVLFACDGFDYDSNSNLGSSSEQKFTRSELAFNVLYSSLLLNDSGLSNNRDGFIVLFNSSSELDEIELKSSGDSSALVGKYAWTIVDDKLQVTYPNGVTCTSNKTSDTSSGYTANSSCSGGEPNNDRIQNSLFKPNSFDDDDIAGRSVTINNDDDDVRIDFYDNKTFEITKLDSRGDDIANTTQIGIFEDSITLNNVVKLDNSDSSSDTYSLLVLLDGGLADGTMLELKYKESTETLTEVLIYSIGENNQWETESLYNSIAVDE